jgi:two-component system cell cycle sensor histidine kinase/response regulator CckA
MIQAAQKTQNPFALARDLDSATLLLTTTLQSVGDGVIVTDVQGRVEFLNFAAERLTGIDSAAAEGRELHEVLPLEEKHGGAVRDNLIDLAVISEATLSLGKDLLLAPPGKAAKQIEGEISVRTTAGQATGTVVTFRDVTNRNWEEVKKREEQKMRAVGQLAGVVAHDLNNLLTVVFGQSEAIEDLAAELPEVCARTAEIQRAASAIAALSRQLLTLSRREVLVPVPVNLNRFLEDAKPKIQKLGLDDIEFVLSLDHTAGNVLLDIAQLEQAILDLVRHARDRMVTGGKLEICTKNIMVDGNSRASHLQRYVQLTVRDSGPSLRGSAVEELLEPSWNRQPGRPSGLGLFTVRNLVSSANGHLSLESEETMGASLVLLFPELQAEAEEPAHTPVVIGVTAKRDRPVTLLLVEDDDGIRILLRNSFEKKGYAVIEARDGEEALLQADLNEGPIDLLVSDVVMPNMDGPTLARHLADTRPDIKILLISGCPNELDDVQHLVFRGDHFVQKPFSQRELLSRVEEIMEVPQ